ncbi:MAG: hypothetical protein UD961_10295 [Bacteroidales bacterium]|nr:hypothetical protein [Bacteroidales bacterium]
MKKIAFIGLIFLVIGLVSCSKQQAVPVVENEVSDATSMTWTDGYIKALSNISSAMETKVGECDDETLTLAAELVEVSKLYLEYNDLDISIYFDDPYDYRIAVVAMALAELDRQPEAVTKTTVGGCALEALGVDALVEGGIKKIGAKAALKIVSKQVLKKAIPYVGWAIAAVDFAACIAE